MKINFPNYIEAMKLPSSKVLYPLFEAISNSIDAIEERSIDNGKILITIERIPQATFGDNEEESKESLAIQSVSIEDNGIGFQEDNFSAFSELNTIWKKSKGGKGVGRVAWLKVFNHAEIHSVYPNGGKANGARHFKFVCKEEPIEVLESTDSNNIEVKTIVRLIECKNEYSESFPRKRRVLAQDIVIHFLPFFMVSNMPEIILREDGLDDIDLWDVFSEYISDKGVTNSFNIAGNDFGITHTKTKYHSQRNKEHRIYFVAHGRVVETRPITSDKISHLPAKLQVNDEEYIYAGYVESAYLDKNVDPSRYKFDIPEALEGEQLFEQVDWSQIDGNVNSLIENYLNEYLIAAEKDKDEKIRQYINEKAPNYSYIYKYHKDLIDKIPYKSIEKGTIGQDLGRIHVTLRSSFSEEAEKVLNIPDSDIKSTDEYKQQLSSLLEKMNPTGKADLAEYIIHRKTILNLLQKALKIGKDQQFQKEDVIHSYVFPIKTSSDEITYNEHNLWLLDERLAYNTYIASDKSFSQIPGFESTDKKQKRKRTDIYAYTYSTVEPNDTRSPYRSLDVFEFKRPMRDDYDSDENPYDQIEEYLEIIRQGKAENKDGRTFSVIEGGLIYCHVICDFTPSLTDMLKRKDFRQVGSEDWYIKFHQVFNALVEVKSFNYMLDVAAKRNQILFDKLGLR